MMVEGVEMDVQQILHALGSDVAITVYLSVAIVAASVFLFFLIRRKKECRKELEQKLKEQRENELKRIIHNNKGE